MKKLILFTVALFLLTSVATQAHWEEEDGHKMHFPQLPDVTGWDVNATWNAIHAQLMLADDWECTETGPVTDIHFWGSWEGDIIGTIERFYINIRANIPADQNPYGDYSMPGGVLKIMQIDSFTIAGPFESPDEGWYDPYTGQYSENDHDYYYQYNIVDIPDPFEQEEGEIYWLEVSAFIQNPVNTQWGWKSTLNNWEDAACLYRTDIYNWMNMSEPPNFEQSLDMSFVISNGETSPIPTLTEWGMIIFMTLIMGVGIVVLYRRRIA